MTMQEMIEIDVFSAKTTKTVKHYSSSNYPFCGHCELFDGDKHCLKYNMITASDLTCKSFKEKK